MRKNLLKKIVAVVATTAMALTAMVAMPTEVKAETTQDLYLVVDADDTYGLCIWEKDYVWTDVEEDTTNWVYPMYKVEDGLYKLVISYGDTWSTTGLSVKVGSNEYKADPQWSGDAGAAAWAEIEPLLNNGEAIYLTLDSENYVLKVTEAPQAETTTTAGAADETTTAGGAEDATTAATGTTTGTPDTGDTTMVALYLAIAALGAVVVLNKKRVNE